MRIFCFRLYRKPLELYFRRFFYLVLLHVSAYSYHNSFSVLATSDCEHINISTGKFSVFGRAHNLKNIFLFNCVLFAKWFRSAKIHCKDKSSFCLRRNVVTMDSLLERLFSGVDIFELILTELALLQTSTNIYTCTNCILSWGFPLVLSPLDTGSWRRQKSVS